jgi:hypothetical protein
MALMALRGTDTHEDARCRPAVGLSPNFPLRTWAWMASQQLCAALNAISHPIAMRMMVQRTSSLDRPGSGWLGQMPSVALALAVDCLPVGTLARPTYTGTASANSGMKKITRRMRGRKMAGMFEV